MKYIYALCNTLMQIFEWLNHTLTTLGCLLTAGFLVCVLMIVRTIQKYKMALEIARLERFSVEHQDMEAVAGENVITAQLDLARAYIEMGCSEKAQAILATVSKYGDVDQRNDAEKMRSGVPA